VRRHAGERLRARELASLVIDRENAPMSKVAIADRVEEVLKTLRAQSTKRDREGMARYAIPSDRAFGVSMGKMLRLAKTLGPSHELATALWKTEWYEARMMAALVGEPERLTVKQMDQWARDFDNWAITDTVCFKLFDRSPHAWGRVTAWSRSKDEMVKRGAFALLASVALHEKGGDDARYVRALALIEKAASDERNFVKKGVSWALRAIGGRNAGLRKKAMELSERLAASDDPTERWLGKDALRGLKKKK
jgi:3-methyladenine DNA glycosylase AlkD